MAELPEVPKVGEYFSRSYLWADKPFADDVRARHRLATYLDEYFSERDYEIGKFIEQELGISCRRIGATRYYVDWKSLLKELDVRDFLDVTTAAIKFEPQHKKYKGHAVVVYNLLEFARRVFVEQNLAYRIDEKGGVHPSIDAAFSISSAGLLRNLSHSGLDAAREHIAQAERSLLAGSFDGRQAIRSVFDAAENLLKVVFPRATQLNTPTIIDKLGPFLIESSGESKPERQASEKLVKSFIDWVEAAHFYRHASGGIEVEQPSESFSVAIVSQGFSFVRWIADAYSSRAASDPNGSN
jgi:hypothetical protein